MKIQDSEKVMEKSWGIPLLLITRDIHINLRDISAIEKLDSMCHDRLSWKARCSMRGTPRDVTTEYSERAARDV